MPTPAHEAITALIIARLGNITIANGYSATPKKIVLSTLTPFQGVDELPIVHVWHTSDDVTANKYGGEQHSLNIIVEITDTSDPVDLPLAKQASRLGADVITALNRDVLAPTVAATSSIALGGVITRLQQRFFDYRIGDGQRPWLAAVVQLAAIYQSPSGDPYTYEA